VLLLSIKIFCPVVDANFFENLEIGFLIYGYFISGYLEILV
jgi:hypothetical protein